MHRRLKWGVAWRAAAVLLVGPGAAWAAVAQTSAANPRPGAQGQFTSVDTPSTAPTSLRVQVTVAESRLAGNLRAPHPGRPEVLEHPDSDHMSGRTPSGNSAVRPTGTAATSLMAAFMPAATATSPQGMDVSSFQGNVNWSAAAGNGATFAYIKATEGTYYIDSAYFAQQYNGSYNAGLVRGAYHFAIPNNSTGAAQADYFVAHGGGWSPDGRTLPGTLDIEYNPYGAECYGLTTSQMVAWIRAFGGEYLILTGRYPTIYTTIGWWSACTGNATGFGVDALAIARYGTSPGTLPASWGIYTIWQYADTGVFPGDQDVFNGSRSQLVEFAYGPSTLPSTVPLTCGTAGDQRTTAEASVQPGVVVASGSLSGPLYRTDTVTLSGQLLPIVTSVPSPSTPLVAVWQNSTDCTGVAQTRNAWAVTPTGAVYGESAQSGPAARNLGDTSKVRLWKPMVGMSPTSDGNGYWLVASDGGIFSYGDARFYGSTGGVRLWKPVVGMATAPNSGGYWMVATDGGVFAFGNAHFHGSLGGIHLVKPIEAMVATADGGGYWMVASDGGVFCFGDAAFKGSMGGHQLSAPIAGLVPNGTGYTLIGQDGRTYPFP